MREVIVSASKQEAIQYELLYNLIVSSQIEELTINSTGQDMCLSVLQIVECIMISKIYAVNGTNEILCELSAKSLYMIWCRFQVEQ